MDLITSESAKIVHYWITTYTSLYLKHRVLSRWFSFPAFSLLLFSFLLFSALLLPLILGHTLVLSALGWTDEGTLHLTYLIILLHYGVHVYELVLEEVH